MHKQQTQKHGQADVKASQALINIENFNLSIFETVSNLTASQGTIDARSTVNVAKNSDGSIAKIYGKIILNTNYDGLITITGTTSLRPSQDITINNAMIVKQIGLLNQSESAVQIRDLVVAQNGTITITARSNANNYNVEISLLPFLYFIKDFGDVPIPE